ncbi:hypothetical protein CsatB_015701 [Cannabis sativa]
MNKPDNKELIFIPLPSGIGNVIPMVETAKTLANHHQSLSITVLITTLTSISVPELAAYTENLFAAAPESSQRIKFIDLSKQDGYDSSAETDPGMLESLFIETQKPLVRSVVAELTRSTQVAGFVVDMFCTAMMDVADEFGVPSYVFYASGAAYLGLLFHFQALRDENGVDPTEFANDSVTEFSVPSFLQSVPATSLPEVLVLKDWAPLLLDHTKRTREAKGIIVNSFTELEFHALKALSTDSKIPPFYPVGPVIRFSSLCGTTEFADVSKWLDAQPLSSVVFLCFGSMGSFREAQLKEIARALDHSGVRFLWSLRKSPPDTCSNPRDFLPSEFFDRTVERGKVTGWVPQPNVLAHPAIGGFVSHCGWNSILESIWFGVPVATWPVYSEQHLNAFQLVKELGLAVEIKLDYKSYFYRELSDEECVVRGEVIEGGIRCLMEQGSEIRKRVKDLSERSKMAILKGGSSYSFMDRFINDVIENCT